ncbi:unnamed protein product [Onchocerca flexuosa]|uniref:Uncharacterized protein n=1 Tax=Onchocerca flexuosa TaxID=387005 RepID=A0A183HWL5_9BILA|nr:unnamed protein product [Onchocerca flexuosa]
MIFRYPLGKIILHFFHYCYSSRILKYFRVWMIHATRIVLSFNW